MTLSVLVQFSTLFLVAAITPNLNFLMPIRPIWLIVLLALQFNWILVALVATLGAVVGTIPLYQLTIHAQRTKTVQSWLARRWVRRLLGWLKGKDFLAIMVIVLSPLPDQLIGVIGGVRNMPITRFLLANFVGRFAFYLLIAYLATIGATYFDSGGLEALPFFQI